LTLFSLCVGEIYSNRIAESERLKTEELDLGIGLIDRLTSDEFKPENYKDEYRIRVLAILDEKSKGKEIVVATTPAPQQRVS
jgi:DNA end-binding protein Ku